MADYSTTGASTTLTQSVPNYYTFTGQEGQVMSFQVDVGLDHVDQGSRSTPC